MADLRVYPYSIEQAAIKNLVDASPQFEKRMPDKHMIRFLEADIPQKFIFRIKEESAATNIQILDMLACFATKREGRAELLRWDILDIVLPL